MARCNSACTDDRRSSRLKHYQHLKLSTYVNTNNAAEEDTYTCVMCVGFMFCNAAEETMARGSQN